MIQYGLTLTATGIIIEIWVIWKIIKSLPSEEENRSNQLNESLDNLSGSPHSHYFDDVLVEIREIQLPIRIGLFLQLLGVFL